MAWPLDTDAEDKLKVNLRDWLRDNDIEAALDGEAHGVKTHVIIKSADETRAAIDAVCEGKKAEWQAWRVTIDVISDDKSGGRRGRKRGAIPPVGSTVAALRALFRHSNYPARNAVGIYTAVLEKDADSRDGVAYQNPFVLTCETFTFLE
jgi:hypothetical protein